MPKAFQFDAFQLGGFQQLVPDLTGGLRFYISGTDRSTRVRRVGNVDLSYTLGSRAVLRCQTLDKHTNPTTAFRPAIDQTLVFTKDSIPLFTGVAVDVGEEALGPPDQYTVNPIEAIDNARVTDQRLINFTYSAPGLWSLKVIAQHMVTNKLAVYGITLDVGMATGPTFTQDIVFENVTVTAAFNYLSNLTGWPWRITPGNVLEMFAPGTKIASFVTLNSANTLSVKIKKRRTKYANRVVATYGGQQQVTETFTGNASQTAFALAYTAVVNTAGMIVSQTYVTVDDHTGFPINFELGRYGTDTSVWTWDSATNILHTLATPGTGTAITFTHAVQVTQTVTVEDAGEVAARGPHEVRIDFENTFDVAAVTAAATAALRKYLVVARELVIRTWAGMAFPGDTCTITLPQRLLSGSWLITETRVRDVSNTRLEYEYSCLEGTEPQPTWVDYFRAAFGGGSSGGSRASVSSISGPLQMGPTGIAAEDVVAWAGTTGKQVRLGQFSSGNWGGVGPGIQFGRGYKVEPTWSIFNSFIGEFGDALRLILGSFNGDEYFSLAIQRTADQQACLLGNRFVGTGISSDEGTFLGDPFNVTGLATSAERTLAGIRAFTVQALNGVFERGRTTQMGKGNTWNPAWASSGTQPALNNGSLVGRYMEVGDLVFFAFQLVVGSTTTVGTGVYTFGLPITANVPTLYDFPVRIEDSGSGFFTGTAYTSSTTTIAILLSTTGVVVGAASPMAWAVGDKLNVSGFYERIP